MLILTLKTDQPEAQITLHEATALLSSKSWQAHRQLAETIHRKITDILQEQHKTLDDLGALVVYKGPGSFTGLRIGISVANALAASLQIPVVGSTSDDWLERGVQRLQAGENDHIVLPEYGAPVHITQPKK